MFKTWFQLSHEEKVKGLKFFCRICGSDELTDDKRNSRLRISIARVHIFPKWEKDIESARHTKKGTFFRSFLSGTTGYLLAAKSQTALTASSRLAYIVGRVRSAYR